MTKKKGKSKGKRGSSSRMTKKKGNGNGKPMSGEDEAAPDMGFWVRLSYVSYMAPAPWFLRAVL